MTEDRRGCVDPGIPCSAWRRGWPAVCLTLLLSIVVVQTAAAQATGEVKGAVRDTLGLAIAGAEVSVEGQGERAVTDATGAYRLARVSVGNRRLRVRRLGFRPTVMDVDVPAGLVSDVDITLLQVVQRLAAVEVRSQREVFDARLSGFYERADRKVGHFITRERIERTHSFSFTDLLREVPGVRIRPIGQLQKAVRIRGASCPPLVFLDGMPASAAEFDVESIDPGILEGIEVYAGSATVPAELVGPRNLDRCGVIAIWTRPIRGRPRGRADDRRAADLSLLLAKEEVYTAEQVESSAQQVGATLVLDYPDELWRAKRSGRVLAEFVVDTAGSVETASFGIIASTHPLFSAAVRQALLRTQFIPARRSGIAVRQVVHFPVDFVYGEPRK
jgi:TonB family protein